MIFDFTTCKASLGSLSQLTSQSEEDILAYIKRHDQCSSARGLMDEFGITDTQLLEADVRCASLHVTTNNDDCESLWRYGLVGLREAVLLDTPLNRYLKEHDINVNLERQVIVYKGKVYPFGENSSNGGCYSRLFSDYVISGFFYSADPLKYGVVGTNPEFLLNLHKLLKSHRVVHDWATNGSNKCYVIKYATALRHYQEAGILYFRGEEDVGLKKIQTLIDKAILNIQGKLRDDCYSFVQRNRSIPPSEFLKVYTADEYLREVLMRPPSGGEECSQ